jgi:hypothetical protein
MKAESVTASCECIKSVDADMKARGFNTQITVNLFGPPRALVQTTQIETGRGKKKASLLFATCCPFCGVKYPESRAAEAKAQ